MDLVFRAAVGFLFVLVITRVIGRRELSSMEPFDIILLVVLGDLLQQGITQDDYSVTGALLVVSVFALLTIAVSYLSFRVPRLRPIIDGEPIVLVQDGRPVNGNLHRERLTLEEVAAEARLQKIDSLDKVAWAILETNGAISFIEKQ
jgi:uncharacterized membrane protein YcaP (DUF421 family)